jgi:hypothetical protein
MALSIFRDVGYFKWRSAIAIFKVGAIVYPGGQYL